jgi:hypothetical protein
MNSETKKFVVAGIEARLRELNEQSRKIGEEITKFGRLRALYTKNGATAETMEHKLAATEKIRSAWRASKAKARKAGKPTRTGHRLKAAQSDADQVLSLLKAHPTPSIVLRDAVKPRDWRLTMKILKTMPNVIVEGNTTRMTLRLGEKS